MIELTGRQRRRLRSLAQVLEPVVTVGKEGITPAVARTISDLLDRRELIKVRLTGPSGAARKEIGPALALAVSGACAGVIGRTVLLYRPNPELAPDKRIDLSPQS